ncbi:MAG: site-specific integrase [Oscillospiraceae bacterium]|nr:site-specific integrase [Oscillospiraceae bacterium]
MSRRGENIYKRKDGRWEGRYKCGIKPDGSIKYSSIYGKTYAETKAKLSERRTDSTASTVPKNLTLNNLFSIWFSDIRLKVKESTYMNYQMKHEKHISLSLGETFYDKLTTESLNDFIQELLSSGLSAKYTADIAGLIRAVCRFAKKRFGYEDKSEFISFPRGASKEKELLDKNEQALLNSYLIANPTLSNVGILLSAATGIRVGELCALKWENIDLEKKILTVKNTVQRVKSIGGNTATKVIITPPKSNSSVRVIPLPEFIVPLLSKLKTNSNCYFLSGSMSLVEPRLMQYRFKRILNELKLTEVTFHSLRHLFATNCISIGVDVKTLSEILGHSSVEITLNRYVHSSIERKAQCMKSLSAFFTVA